MIKPTDLLQPAGAASTLDHPLEHLKACHRRIEDRLSALERVAESLPARRSEALPVLANIIRFLDSNGVFHTEDEERSLFPRLRPRAGPEEMAFFARLEADHADAEATYADLKSVAGVIVKQPERTDGLAPQFTRLVTRLCAIYRRHIQEEDSMLQEIAARILTEADLAEISVEMKQRRGMR